MVLAPVIRIPVSLGLLRTGLIIPVVGVGLALALLPLPTALFLAVWLGAVRLVWHLGQREEAGARVDAAKLGHECSPAS